MQINSTLRFHAATVRVGVIKHSETGLMRVEWEGSRLCCWWKHKLAQPLWKISVESLLKRLKTKLPPDPLLGIYLEELSQHTIGTPEFLCS